MDEREMSPYEVMMWLLFAACSGRPCGARRPAMSDSSESAGEQVAGILVMCDALIDWADDDPYLCDDCGHAETMHRSYAGWSFRCWQDCNCTTRPAPRSSREDTNE